MNDNLGLEGEILWKPGYTRRAILAIGAGAAGAYVGAPVLRKIIGWYLGGVRNEYDWDYIAAPATADYKRMNMDKSSIGITMYQLSDAASRPEFETGLADPETMRSLLLKIKDGKLEGKLEGIMVQGDYLGFRITTEERGTSFYYAKINPELRKRLTSY